MPIRTTSAAATKRLAGFLARECLEALHDPGRHEALVVSLEGDLGAGKTTFTQGFASALGVRDIVRSPTFVLLKGYAVPRMKGATLYHLDAYRLQGAEDMTLLGWKDVLRDPRALVLVEWGDRVRRALPRERLVVHLQHLSTRERLIAVRAHP